MKLDKDYFSPLEAASYACVPLQTFLEHAENLGILSFEFMGQKIFRRADIQTAMELQWRKYTNAEQAIISRTTMRRGRGIDRALAELAKPMPRQRAQRLSEN